MIHGCCDQPGEEQRPLVYAVSDDGDTSAQESLCRQVVEQFVVQRDMVNDGPRHQQQQCGRYQTGQHSGSKRPTAQEPG